MKDKPTWRALNSTVLNLEDEDTLWSLLEQEMARGRRDRALRVYSRFSKVRAARERREIMGVPA